MPVHVRSRIEQAQERGNATTLVRFGATGLRTLLKSATQQAHTLYLAGHPDFPTTFDTNRSLASTESALAASVAQLASYPDRVFLALGGEW